MALLTALLDANVLYPAGLRDLLFRLADRGLYTPLWSAAIHHEWITSLLTDRPDIEFDALNRTRMLMDEHFPSAAVTGHEAVVVALNLPDPSDRHVLAAAIHGQAHIIVTYNLRDFPSDRLASYALEARHSDTFIAGLLEADFNGVLAAIRDHRAALLNPPRSASDHLAALAGFDLVRTRELLRPYETVI